MRPVRIVVDSTADLPARVVAELGISVVPCLLHFGQESFREGIDISRAEFFRRLQTDPNFPHTAAPAPGLFEDTYRRLAAETDTVVSIHLSSQHSGVFNSARLGAEAVAGKLRVETFDSGQISLGMGLMAIAAAEAAREGASSVEILELLEGLRGRTHLLAIINDLDNLRRGGRVSQLVARLGNLLHIKPILHVHQGEVLLHERVRSWARAEQRVRDMVRSMAPFERLVLGHIERSEAANALGQALADVLPARTYHFEAGVTIGIHVGVGAVGVAFMRVAGGARPGVSELAGAPETGPA